MYKQVTIGTQNNSCSFFDSLCYAFSTITPRLTVIEWLAMVKDKGYCVIITADLAFTHLIYKNVSLRFIKIIPRWYSPLLSLLGLFMYRYQMFCVCFRRAFVPNFMFTADSFIIPSLVFKVMLSVKWWHNYIIAVVVPPCQLKSQGKANTPFYFLELNT